jgi:Ca2+-binding EF-hand superfamily protein
MAVMSREQEELVQKVQALMARKFGGTDPGAMRKLFDAYDRNGDGKIEAHELETLLADAGVGNMLTRGAWIKGIISALDQNSDRHIDWDEFSKAVG